MKSKGFTLIELLVVVAIIGILAAVGVVAYNGYTASAKEKVALRNYNTVIRLISANFALCDTGLSEVQLDKDHKINCHQNPSNAYQRTNFHHQITDIYDDYIAFFSGKLKNPYDTSKDAVGHYSTVGSVNLGYAKYTCPDGKFSFALLVGLRGAGNPSKNLLLEQWCL
jgi:type IV pilus assembly protein PilA